MSSVYRVGVQIYGNASGYIGTVNQVLRGTTRLAQGFRSTTNESRLLSNQMKAIGTTARYAFAGSLIFGITGAISRLQDFSAELGTIDSLAGQLNEQGKFQGLGNQLQDIGSEAIKLSDHFGAAVTDVEAYMARFYSTFQADKMKDPTRQMEDFTGAILKLQTALGSEAGDPAALAGGIGGLINVIPGGKRNPGATANRLGNLIAYLTQVTPNITGTDVANAAGRFASIYNTANITPEQLFAIYGQAAKAGGSPSIVTRGVQQLLGQSLLHPLTPTNKAAYTAAGLPTDPNALRNMGGMAVLERLLSVVAPHGTNLTRNQLQAANAATTKDQLAAALPGLNVSELFNLFGRIQSVQQFVNILSQGGVRGLQQYIREQDAATRANLLNQRASNALREQGLKVLSNAMKNVSLSLVRGLNTPLSVFGRLVSKFSDELAGHRTTTTAIEGGAASVAILRLLGKTNIGAQALGHIPVLGRLVGANRIFQRAAGAAIMAEETAAVASGTAADGSRANPFWVIISPYSWQFGSGGLSQPTSKPPGLIKNIERKAPPFLPIGGASIAGAAATAGALLGIPAWALVSGQGKPYQLGNLGRFQMAHGKPTFFPTGFRMPQSGMGSALLNAFTAAHLGPGAVRDISVTGTAKADLTIRLVDKAGNEITIVEKKGVPISVTKDTAPTSQGRNGVRKGK